MRLLGYEVVRTVPVGRFYWWPRRVTLYIRPPIYRWGVWNFCRVNVNLESWQ
jgi:hypothetical protein